MAIGSEWTPGTQTLEEYIRAHPMKDYINELRLALEKAEAALAQERALWWSAEESLSFALAALAQERAARDLNIAIVVRDGQVFDVELFTSSADCLAWQKEYGQQEDETIVIAQGVKPWQNRAALAPTTGAGAGEG